MSAEPNSRDDQRSSDVTLARPGAAPTRDRMLDRFDLFHRSSVGVQPAQRYRDLPDDDGEDVIRIG